MQLSPQMTPGELRERAVAEVDELGPEPPNLIELRLWREERRGVSVLLAGLADWDSVRLRRAAMAASGAISEAVRAVLVDAAAIATEETGNPSKTR